MIGQFTCGKIDNVLCYFGDHDALVKLELLIRSSCDDFYDNVQWNMSHSAVEQI